MMARRMMARSSFGAALLLLTLACACSGKDPYKPGEPIGTFRVTSKLTKSTCGSVPDPWEFDVRLRREGTTLYWVQGGAPIQGKVDTQSRAQLASELTQVLRPANERTKTPSCAVTRTDLLDVVLAPGGDIAKTDRFTGTLAYRFTPTSESDCSDQLLTTGGDFETLPCEVTYSVDGTVLADPDEKASQGTAK